MKEIVNDGSKMFQFKTGDLVYHERIKEYFIIVSEPYYSTDIEGWIESSLIRREVIRLSNMQTAHMGRLGFNTCKLFGRIENESNNTRNNR